MEALLGQTKRRNWKYFTLELFHLHTKNLSYTKPVLSIAQSVVARKIHFEHEWFTSVLVILNCRSSFSEHIFKKSRRDSGAAATFLFAK